MDLRFVVAAMSHCGRLGEEMSSYEDAYPTCKGTFATLRIFSDSVSPAETTARLKIEPTEFFVKGEPMGPRGGSRKFNGWFLSSERFVDSRDSRRHIDWILRQIEGKASEIARWQGAGVEIDISCVWISAGQGGPVISPAQMSVLSTLNIEVWWDVYFDHDSNESK
jgi:hypothetical protein